MGTANNLKTGLNVNIKTGFVILVIIVNTLLLGSAFANTVDKKAKDIPIQPNMHKLFDQMKDILPYMVDDKKFEDPKNSSVILRKLGVLKKTSQSIKHSSVLKDTTFQISQEVLQNHFSEIERTFRLGNKSYARWQLHSTVPLCMSCHTQTPSASKHWDITDLIKGKINDFEKAELLFMGRDFEDALKYYDKVINGFPDNKISAQVLEKSLERKVVVFSRVKRDFPLGIKSLEANLKNNKIPDAIDKNIRAWIAAFRIQMREGVPDPKKAKDAQIKKYVEKEIKNGLWDDMVDATNPRLVKNLTMSGLLYEYLIINPKTPLKPDILNWLALLDKQLQETIFYSLADLYLKECMREFPKHPTAKKCYEAYKDNMISSYSGSGGIFLPDDVKKELKEWSIKVHGEDKSQVDE